MNIWKCSKSKGNTGISAEIGLCENQITSSYDYQCKETRQIIGSMYANNTQKSRNCHNRKEMEWHVGKGTTFLKMPQLSYGGA